ncbi:MAG: BatD family protein, partial [Myxococcales bacterium]|nr:BatD family protein [Myxococcales bacterium]
QLQEPVNLFFGPRQPGRPAQSYAGRNLAVEVKPLPAEGQPPDFPANNVGSFTLEAAVDRETLRQGEAVRLTVTIAGIGNVALVSLGKAFERGPTVPGARTYEPKPEAPVLETGGPRLKGSRSYTMLVVAEQSGTLHIPAFELHYFDPEAAAYQVAKTEPITLQVEANPNLPAAATDGAKGVAQADAAGESKGDQELLAAPLAGSTLDRVTPRERWLSSGRWWAGTLTAPVLLGLGWLGSRLADRLGPTEAARARAQRLTDRRRLLAEAEAAVSGGEGFHIKLADALQAAAVGRAGSEGVGLTRNRLMDLLAGQGVATGELETLQELLDACDAARFGAGAGDVEARRSQLDRARSLLAGKGWRDA